MDSRWPVRVGLKKFNKKQHMKQEQLSRENAISELNRWYDILCVPEESRIDKDNDDDQDKSDVMRERVIRAIQTGSLVLNDKDQMQYTLNEKVCKKDSGEVVIDVLVFKNRYRGFELESNMKGVKPDDFMQMSRAYIATLTGKGKALISRMYNRDLDICQAIYLLFTRGEA